MPHAVIKTQEPLIAIDDKDIFFSSSGSAFVYPAETACEAFFIKAYSKRDHVIVKLEKATHPLITDCLKGKVLEFAKYLAERLKGSIVHHNLKPTGKNCRLFEKYLLDLRIINHTVINKLFDKPIELEIGSAKGEFITKIASKNKEKQFIGIEIVQETLSKALLRVEKLNLQNISFIHYDARFLLDRFLPDSVDAVYVFFPEPWFKKKRLKHALFDRLTLSKIANILKNGGIFKLFTDNHAYALSISTALDDLDQLTSTTQYPFMVATERIDTYYERRWLKRNRTIYKLTYTKTKHHQALDLPDIKFPIKINKEYILKDNIIFKILDIYENPFDERIAEVVFGYSLNPQHTFFGLTKNNELFEIAQSRFIADSQAKKAFELAK
ncbi:tRNA (guanosine(46)-N7)-methyltransferase TrmB [Hippea jasoniae]|uniref:tRNA (guanosine(46)-N7)-methyltransferase TrmB n=1 Tax=Hippea jasoniae TaxID=944479 RepID=UPI0005599FE7|nr:tRNA (guanosine(46)-N7)-methyltransferase TrmB [Hippea jasoniae]